MPPVLVTSCVPTSVPSPGEECFTIGSEQPALAKGSGSARPPGQDWPEGLHLRSCALIQPQHGPRQDEELDHAECGGGLPRRN